MLTKNYWNWSNSDWGRDTSTVLHRLHRRGKRERRFIYMEDYALKREKGLLDYLQHTLLPYQRKPTRQMPEYCAWFYTQTGEGYVLSPSVIDSWTTRRSTFNYDINAILVRTSPIDGAGKKILPTSLQSHLYYHSHYPTMAGHLGEKGMHDSMQREYYWPHIAYDDYTTVGYCPKCVQNESSEKCRGISHLFSANGLLKVVAMNMLASLPKRVNAHQ